MPESPTIPPVPKRPPPKPNKIPPVVETAGTRKYPIDPFQGINRIHHAPAPIRPPSPSETDLEVVRHEEQIKGLERRIGDLEDTAKSVDKKLDNISEVLTSELNSRKLSEAAKEEQKTIEDQKTKRFQALLVAIPLILSPILGFYASYMQKPTPDYKTPVVVVSEYTEDAAKCKESSRSQEQYVKCIREAQLKNTPKFEQ